MCHTNKWTVLKSITKETAREKGGGALKVKT